MSRINVKFKKLIPSARVPTKANNDDVGFDLFAPMPCHGYDFLLLGNVTKIQTGISFADYFSEEKKRSGKIYAKIESRSGLASRGIIAVGGIIDLGYRGDLTVVLANLTGEEQKIDLNKAIAQLVFYNIENDVNFEEVEEVENSFRGTKGFGSTDQ